MEKKVTSLADFKARKQEAAVDSLFMPQEGAFEFDLFELDESDVPNGVGIIDLEETPITILLDKEKHTGIRMTLETARQLAVDVLNACDEVEGSKKDGA